jgi:putative membrane protein
VDLLLGTLMLRPYVFGFLAAYLVAGTLDLGLRRTMLFTASVWPVALLAELSSTRTGFPFGFYTYTQTTRGQELFILNVPFMDSLSFTFLAYASFCLARVVLRGRGGRAALALGSGICMMLLDMVIDPTAVRGDQWFLGWIFYYPDGGPYFDVPLSNFAGWVLVGTVGVGIYLRLRGTAAERAGQDAEGVRVTPGVALYYAVLSFNLIVTAWIGEWMLVAAGVGVHTASGGAALLIATRPGGVRWGKRGNHRG